MAANDRDGTSANRSTDHAVALTMAHVAAVRVLVALIVVFEVGVRLVPPDGMTFTERQRARRPPGAG